MGFEKNIFANLTFSKPTLWASLAFPYASLLTFELAKASPASECLA